MADSPPTFETPRLLLVPVDLTFACAVGEGGDTLTNLLGASVADGFPDSPNMYEYVAAQLRTDPSLSWWLAWSIRDRATGTVVGDIGFHGPPDERGSVEIGYSIAPTWRRRGLATEALRAFLAWALQRPEITAVRAETESSNHASIAILRRLGFEETGTYIDATDGAELITFVSGSRTGAMTS